MPWDSAKRNKKRKGKGKTGVFSGSHKKRGRGRKIREKYVTGAGLFYVRYP
jgi:hypothetical protein